MLTGEPMPVRKAAGDEVVGATINTTGTVVMRATTVGGDTALAQIVRLIEDAQLAKAPIQAFADRAAQRFTPAVLALSLGTFFVWLALSYCVVPPSWLAQEGAKDDPFLFSLLFGISVVVVACPCALGLATPTAVMVGTAVGARHGVLIKGGEPLETAHRVRAVVFDKTGTLTFGKPVVKAHALFGGAGVLGAKAASAALDFALAVAASAEAHSEHPVGRALVLKAQAAAAAPSPVKDGSFTVVVGAGVSCTLELGAARAAEAAAFGCACAAGGEAECLVGSPRLLERHGVPLLAADAAEVERLELAG